MHFTTLWLWWLRLRCLPNIWWLMTTRRNFRQPVLIRIYHVCAIMEACLPFYWHVEHVSSEHYCHAEVFCSANYGAIAVIASTTYMTIMELFNECPTPPPLRWWYNWLWQRIYYWMASNYWWKQKLQSLLLRGVGSGLDQSSPPSCFLSWHGD